MDAESERQKERYRQLLQSVNHTKNLSPQERMDLFFKLQHTAFQTYMDGLRSRHPDASPEELAELARKEGLKHG